MHSAIHAKMPIFNCYFYLLQFRNHYIFHLYVYFTTICLLSERFAVALLLAVPINLKKSLQTTNLYILLCQVSVSKVK